MHLAKNKPKAKAQPKDMAVKEMQMPRLCLFGAKLASAHPESTRDFSNFLL